MNRKSEQVQKSVNSVIRRARILSRTQRIETGLVKTRLIGLFLGFFICFILFLVLPLSIAFFCELFIN